MRLIPIEALNRRLDALLPEEEFRDAWNERGYTLPDEADLVPLVRALFFLDLCASQKRTLRGLTVKSIHYNRLRRFVEAMNALARRGDLDLEWETAFAEALEQAAEAGLEAEVINRICSRQRWQDSMTVEEDFDDDDLPIEEEEGDDPEEATKAGGLSKAEMN